MGLSYPGVLAFYGTIGHIKLGEWKFDVKRTKFFGVIGESEIPGGMGARSLEVPYWMYSESITTGGEANDSIDFINSYIGENGTLTEDGTIERTFENTTFDGFVVERGPILTNIGWLVTGTLKFTQLQPNGT